MMIICLLGEHYHISSQQPELETTGGREELGPENSRWFWSTVTTNLTHTTTSRLHHPHVSPHVHPHVSVYTVRVIRPVSVHVPYACEVIRTVSIHLEIYGVSLKVLHCYLVSSPFCFIHSRSPHVSVMSHWATHWSSHRSSHWSSHRSAHRSSNWSAHWSSHWSAHWSAHRPIHIIKGARPSIVVVHLK